MFKSFSSFWQNFSVFAGRTTRRDFWLTALAQFIIVGILFGISRFVGFMVYVMAVYVLTCFVPSLALCVRRLHDVGKKGSFLWLLLIMLIGWIIVLVKLLSDSQKGTNKFGESEKYPDSTSETAAEDFAAPPMEIPPIYASQPRTELGEESEKPFVVSEVAPVAPAPVVQQQEAESPAEDSSAASESFQETEESFGFEETFETPYQKPAKVYRPAPKPGYRPPVAPAQPAAPAYQPAQPVAPAYQPAQPAAPAYQPAQPVAPAYQPAQPVAPAYQPAQPAAPAYQPAQPVGNKETSHAPLRPKGYKTKGFPYGH